jgi:hypothetical protein
VIQAILWRPDQSLTLIVRVGIHNSHGKLPIDLSQSGFGSSPSDVLTVVLTSEAVCESENS